MKDLFENFRRFTEGDSTNLKKAALKKAMRNLGINTATATAPKPEKPKPKMPRRLEKLLQDRGFWVNLSLIHI